MHQEPDTRTRLLEAAGQVFAERGFKAATIREIVDRAGANLAAVNYHFGDKESLFSEVLRDTVREALDRYPADGGVAPDQPAEERLEAAIRNFLQRGLGAGQTGWRGQLMAREMADPGPLTLDTVEPLVRPVHEHLASLVRELVGPDLDETRAWLCSTSIISQCVLARKWELLGDRFGPPQLPPAPRRFELLADHITRFSLAALRGLRSEETP